LPSGTVIFTTSSVLSAIELYLNEDIVFENEISPSEICGYVSKKLILHSFGKFVEGIDLSCYDRIVILGLPLLPPQVMKRLEVYGIDYRNLTITKTVQLIGRILTGIKDIDEKKEIILADRRFLKFKDDLKHYEINCLVT